MVETAAREKKGRDQQNGDENRAQSDHDVIAVVNQRDEVRPFALGKTIEPADLRHPLAIGEEAERARNDQRVIEPPVLHIGLAEDGQRRAFLADEQSFHGREGDRLIARDQNTLHVPGRVKLEQGSDHSDDDSGAQEDAGVGFKFSAKQVERGDRNHDEAAGLHRAEHVVGVLPEGPGIQEQPPEAGQRVFAAVHGRVGHRMLHPGVGGDNEKARGPGAQPDEQDREPVADLPEALLAKKHQAEKTRLQKKRKYSFHGQRLPDDAAGGAREGGPIGAELELHGDAGDDADGKINGEDAHPEAHGAVVFFVSGTQRGGFQDEQEEGQAHGQLRE